MAICLLAAMVAGCGAAGHRSGPHPGTTGALASSRPAHDPTSPGTGAGAGSATTGTAPATTATSSTTPVAPTAPPASVTYGIGDAQGQFASCAPGDPDCCSATRARCSLTELEGFFDNRLFLKLLTPASAHRVRDVRLFVDYDAVAEWNGSTTSPGCQYSRILEHPYYDLANGWQSAGESIDELVAGVIEARAEGLTPVVAIQGYSYATAKPPWDAAAPDPTTLGGYWEYRCGVQGILGVMSQLPAWEQPHAWEAFNEPDSFPLFRSSDGTEASSCAVTSTPAPDGPAKAACLEVIASQVIHGYADHGGDTVIAGTFMTPSPAYLGPYVDMIAQEMPGAAFPATWSVHDYREVTDAFSGVSATQLAGFDDALAADSDGRAKSLWITEAGTVLDSGVRSGDCPAIGVDPAGTLGACVSGQTGRQTIDADRFFSLPTVATAVPITHLFWYEFRASSKWDSGLTDAAGIPRGAYCVFYGSGVCAGNPAASQ